MKRYSIFIIILMLAGFPILVDAASITNADKEVHQIKARKPGNSWVYVEINPRGTKYFNCRYGCELVLEKTGSSIQLDTDGDIVIKDGVLSEK